MLWADTCDTTLRAFEFCASRENLIELNGVWNRAILYYDRIVLIEPPEDDKPKRKRLTHHRSRR